MLDELEEVDGGVEQTGRKFLLEVGIRFFGLNTLDILRYVNEGSDVDGELAEYRTDDVNVEDIVLRALFGEGFDGLPSC